MQRHLWIFSLFIFFLFLALPGHAAEIKINPGFNGNMAVNCWNPVRVEITGTVEQGRLEMIRWNDEYAVPLVESFSCRGEERVEWPVFTTSGLRSEIRLWSGNQLLIQESLDWKSRLFPGHIILTVGIEPTAQQELAGILMPTERVLIVPVNIGDLPASGLGYDGVSALVLQDPGSVLGPAQLRALRGWLLGGGRLVFGIVNPEGRSLATELLGSAYMFPKNGMHEVIPFGLGRVALFRDAPSGGPEFWRETIDLRPFRDHQRMNSIRLFGGPEEIPDERQKENLANFETTGWVLLILGVWAGLALFLIWLPRKRVIVRVLVLTIIFALVALPVGENLTRNWGRGFSARTRAVIFPGHDFLMAETCFHVQMVNWWKFKRGQSSPWGGIIRKGAREEGFPTPWADTWAWNHRTIAPESMLRYGNHRFMMLESRSGIAGTLTEKGTPDGKRFNMATPSGPVSVPEVLGRETDFVFRNREGRWYIIEYDGDTPVWQESVGIPSWLEDSEWWISKLSNLAPSASWLIGRTYPPELRISVQNALRNELTWAMPVKGEG